MKKINIFTFYIRIMNNRQIIFVQDFNLQVLLDFIVNAK